MSVSRIVRLGALLAAIVIVLAACSSDGDGADGTTVAPSESSEGPVANACPADGCSITFVDVTNEGEELAIVWDANFLPDVSKNHIHLYWDTFTADQVTSDAEARGEVQGDWHPTDDFPTHVTESGASLVNRGDSTTLCVTAADRDHVVLDATIVDCRDVSDLL